jgi:hypothetical protein
LERPQRLVHGQDDVGDGGVAGLAGQAVAAAGAPGADHQPFAAQPGEQLFEIGKRDLLTGGDLGQGHGPALRLVLAAGQIGHGHHRVASLGAQAHAPYLLADSPRIGLGVCYKPRLRAEALAKDQGARCGFRKTKRSGQVFLRLFRREETGPSPLFG